MATYCKKFKKDWPLHVNLKGVRLEEIKDCLKVEKPKDELASLEKFIQKSNEFPIKFPIDTCRVKSQPKERLGCIQKQISSAYPIIHEKILFLMVDFLKHKRKNGNTLEKALYKTMTIMEFVQRLLTKRCVTFLPYCDVALLINGKKRSIDLENALSYDEMKISAFLSISTHTDFINDGRRENKGVVEMDLNKIEKEGVLVGLVSPHYAYELKLDFEDVLISKEQNTRMRGYGFEKKFAKKLPHDRVPNLLKLRNDRKLWNKFYDEKKDYLYTDEPIDNQRFGRCDRTRRIFYDKVVMKKRYALPFDLLLLEANQRAQLQNKLAYIHVVGIGLGMWKGAAEQEDIFMACFQQRLKFLLDKLNNVGVIHFSWFQLKAYDDLKDEGFLASETHARGGIQILISNRNPHEKLPPAYSDMLPVISFGMDGNALPGNEFWTGKLSQSSDSAAACSTLITELANPHINTTYVNCNNLHIASIEHGVLHIKNYVERILEKKTKRGIKVFLCV